MQVSTIGPYRIIRKLSAGGMGTVYEAIHEAIERRVAIKILHPQLAASADTVRRFFNEAKAANRIDHPAIVQVQDCGQLPDGTSFIVMEYLRGETLGRRLRRPSTRRLLAQNLRLMAQVAEALAAAHAAGIIHRDRSQISISHLRCTARTSQRRRDTDAAPHRSHASPYSYIL